MNNNEFKLKELTLEEYQKLLDKHDWFYEYTDDPNVWKQGKNNESYLIVLYQYNDLKAGKKAKEPYWKLFKVKLDEYSKKITENQ